MAPLKLAAAKTRVKRILDQYWKFRTSDEEWFDDLTGGKVYELYVLGKIIGELRARGFTLKFVGTTIRFKASPGLINSNDPHFDVFPPWSNKPVFKLYLDIEFRTLGADQTGSHGKCGHHEIDIVIVDPDANGMPSYDQIALGVECKSHANFTKNIIKEVLGIRRELCLLHDKQESKLSQKQWPGKVFVPAEPPSEFWLAYIDPKGNGYQTSPSYFGIEFKNWTP